MTTSIRKNQNWLPGFIFNDFFDNDWMNYASSNFTTPATNVMENENGYSVDIAAPGMTKNDFNIKIDENNVLTVSMEKKEEKKDENKKMRFLRREFSYTQFTKSLILPDDVEKENIEAKIENGVLNISIPKKEEKKAVNAVKVIEVK
jgi:Molecular chaperone (small heat shock protein)